jgi:sugar/nucleoside kinase (ribokinase family)
MAGGTSYYFSNAISHMDLNYMLVTSLAEKDKDIVEELRSNHIEVKAFPSAYTVYFENIYSNNQDHRTQRVAQKADPFTANQLLSVDARIYHLGPLLADDIPSELFKSLSEKGMISLDVQGYLREVRNRNVYAIDWPAKKEALQYVHVLKANESEMSVLTGETDVRKGARILFEWGVREVVITLGSKGSVIYNGRNFHIIPAYHPMTSVVDATGCGDTYMAGYLYSRSKGKSLQESGEFAAAMATLKIESSGPFTGTEEDILSLLANNKRKIFAEEV